VFSFQLYRPPIAIGASSKALHNPNFHAISAYDGKRSCNQLNDATSLGDLPLCLLAHPSCAHHQRDGGDSAFAENLAVAEREEIQNGDCVFLAALLEVFFPLICWHERPEL
jgi:hypothetical protein